MEHFLLVSLHSNQLLGKLQVDLPVKYNTYIHVRKCLRAAPRQMHKCTRHAIQKGPIFPHVANQHCSRARINTLRFVVHVKDPDPCRFTQSLVPSKPDKFPGKVPEIVCWGLIRWSSCQGNSANTQGITPSSLIQTLV